MPIPSPVDSFRTTPLIINNGTLPGLVACWSAGVVRPAATKPGGGSGGGVGPVAWFPLDDKPARERRRAAVARQVELCALTGMSDKATVRFDLPAHSNLHQAIAAGARTDAMLLSATIEAAALGLSRVIWPVHLGGTREVDTDALADVCDRALLIAQLAGLDRSRLGASGGTIRIETPYADLTDAQLMDLALDMDTPLHAAWWCMNDDDRACGQCAGCMRWREALVQVDPAGRLDIQVLATAPTGTAPLKQK